MNTLDFIKRLGDESRNLPDVIAPILTKKDTVKVFINNHPYKLSVEADSPGWHIIRPTTESSAVCIRNASPYEIKQCLESVQKLRLISMRRIDESKWLAFPFNVSDAQSKKFKIQPLIVFLIDQNLEPFSVISARLWSNTLLFDSYVYPPNFKYTDSLDQGNTEPPEISGITPEFKTVYSMLTDEIEKARKKTVEGRIESAVRYLGAELVGFREFGDGFEIDYRDHGNSYKVRVSDSLRLRSAGICLSGLENQQTLASCVAVMRQSRSRQYFDDYDEDDE